MAKYQRPLPGRAPVRQAIQTAKNVYKGVKIAKKVYNKWKKGNSNTKNRTKRRSPNVMSAIKSADRLYTKTVCKPSKAARMYGKLGSKTTYEIIATQGMQSTEGYQGVYQLGKGFDSGTVLDACRKTVIAYETTSVLKATAAGTASARKFLLGSDRQECKVANTTSGIVQVKIYHCISKVTSITSQTIYDDWTSGLNEEKAMADADSLTTATFAYPGSDPRSVKKFNINWRVVNVKTLDLAPSQQVVDIWDNHQNKVIDQEYFEDNLRVRGITTATLIVFVGALADASNSIAIGNISLAPSKLITTQSHTITVQLLSPYQKANYYCANPFTHADTHLYAENVVGTVLDVATTFS